MLYIANQIDSNIRELEGALIRVVAYSSLINKDINADLAAEALKDIIPNSKPKLSPFMIFKSCWRCLSSKIRRFQGEKAHKVSCLSSPNCNVFVTRTDRFLLT